MSDTKPTQLHAVPTLHERPAHLPPQPVHPLVRKRVAVAALAITEQCLAIKEVRGRLYACSTVGEVRDLLTSMLLERETRLQAVANG